MSWIKINTTLPRNPKILLLGQHLGISRYEALGLAVEWLAWLDGITANGETGLSAELMDRLFYTEFLSQKNVTSVTDICDTCHTNVTKLSHALSQIGWLHVDENGIIHVLDFEKHNGETAKKRAEAAERQRKSRSAKLSQKSVTNVTKKCDQIREENIYNREIPNESYTTVCGGATAGERLPHVYPENAQEVENFMANSAVCGLQGEELKTCAEVFFNNSEAVGWTLKGQPMKDWRAACRAFVARWQQNKQARPEAAQSKSFTFRSQTKQNYDL